MKIKDVDKTLAEAASFDGYGWRDAAYKKRIKPKPVKENNTDMQKW